MKTLLVAALFLSSHAFAWGPTGHRVVGQVAERFMEPALLLKAKKIVEGESLPRVATWADEIKSRPETYSYTYSWHYTDWPDHSHDHSEEASTGKLLSAINEQIAVLKNQGASNDKKAFAIKFLAHLIGDLHQPLHVGNGTDRGGNLCRVLFHDKPMSLHKLWDEGMIDFTKLSFTEMANFVSQGRKLEEIRDWRKGTVLDWAKESKDIRNELYPPEVVPSSESGSMKRYCRRDIELPLEETPKLGFEYSDKFKLVMEKRLFQAGLRLAKILNESLK